MVLDFEYQVVRVREHNKNNCTIEMTNELVSRTTNPLKTKNKRERVLFSVDTVLVRTSEMHSCDDKLHWRKVKNNPRIKYLLCQDYRLTLLKKLEIRLSSAHSDQILHFKTEFTSFIDFSNVKLCMKQT